MAISLDGIAESLIEAARQPFLVLDHEMRVVAANPSFCRTFHVSMENILGHPLSQVCQSGWDIPALKEALHRMPERGDSFDDIEVESVFPSIGLRTLRMSARAVAADVAAGRHTVLSIEDITERRRMETELKESEVRYRRLFEAAQDGILILDAASGLIEQANPYLAGILGVPPSSLVGREMWDVGFFSNSEASRRAFRILQDKGYIRFEDLPLATREGKLVDVEFVCNRYSVGNRDKIQCNIRDVSDRKRAEAALRAAEKEIRQSLKMEAIGTLAGGVAHEFNNLLTSINGYTALSLPYAGTEGPLREYLNEIQKAGDRAAVLTRQLLAYSQKQILEPKTVNVNALVSKVVRLLEGLAGRDIELVEDLDSDLGWVRADPVQIEQALLNLAVNARDSLPQGGRITFRTRKAAPRGTGADAGRTRPHILVSIIDTGPGIDAAAQARIFDPFFAGRKDTGMGGLALSMAQGIVAQSGGLVQVESEPGQGTTFQVFLPLAEEGPRLPLGRTARDEMEVSERP